MPQGDEKPLGFSRSDARRIGEAVKWAESFPRGTGNAPRQGFTAAYTAGRWVRLTANIAARSGATCHSGPVVFVDLIAGVFTDSAETGTAWNGTTKTLTGGPNRFFFASWANGEWWLWPSSCDDLS